MNQNYREKTREFSDRLLADSHNSIGSVLQAQGDLTGSLTAYRRSMESHLRLAASDPSNSEWQHDLSINHDRIGDVLLARGDLGGALAAYRSFMDIAARLVASDPSNTEWQRDLSASHSKIGNVLQAKGDATEALAAYQRGMEIRIGLTGSDPSNAERQPDLSVRVDQGAIAGTAITSVSGSTVTTNHDPQLNPDYTWDIARLDRDLRTLKAAKPPPDSVIYAETETGFAIVQGQGTDEEVAAQPATAQRHRNVIAKIEDLIDACGTRLDNQRSWRRLPKIAKRALEAADRPTIELPDALVDLYDHTVSLGSYVSQDDAISADKNASDAPLDHDIRRALVDFISSASPWLRSFPSVLAADDARRDFLTRPELFEPIRRTLPAAREFLEIAGREGVLSPEDAARATLPIETAERGGVLGEKAGYRGHGNALGLLTRTALVSLISFYSGAIASDFATKSLLVQRAGSFLARAEEHALQLAASAPDDLRIALENVLKVNRLRQEANPPPQTPAIMPADGSKPFRPPLESWLGKS
ncbi:MAG: hypothetical protein ACK5X3_10680 [Pseudomonadota bacterium]